MDVTVPAVHNWPTNAALIADANRLHPLGDYVIDLTYGRGNWWAEYRPRILWTNDIDPDSPAVYHFDFRHMPLVPHRFDGVAFDPPYKFNGTPVLGEFDARYGLTYQPWQEKLTGILDGLTEALRLVRKGGLVYAKCQDQVVSGKMRWQTHALMTRGEECGARLLDRFDMIGGGRVQPEGTRQLHARDRGSTLLVFKLERVAEGA